MGLTGSLPSILADHLQIIADKNDDKRTSEEVPYSADPLSATSMPEVPFETLEIKQSIYELLRQNFFVLSPRTNRGWSGRKVRNFVVNFVKKWNSSSNKSQKIDITRIHVTGPSMGGAGTFSAANIGAPAIFATCVPICAAGGVIAENFPLAETNVWAWHAVNDEVVPVTVSDEAIQALETVAKKRNMNGTKTAVNGAIKYTREPHAPAPAGWPHYPGHAGWMSTYRSKELYSWMLKSKLEMSEGLKKLFEVDSTSATTADGNLSKRTKKDNEL
ncbi:unnamed protein product [Amoebophrya sp. A120]|nr:unnamed protein product [Amoebophrya sp. A120]|eukprot:GSA120T00016531001.1